MVDLPQGISVEDIVLFGSQGYCHQVATAEDIAHLYVEVNIRMAPGKNVTCPVAQSGSACEVEQREGCYNNEHEEGKAVFNNKFCEILIHVFKRCLSVKTDRYLYFVDSCVYMPHPRISC